MTHSCMLMFTREAYNECGREQNYFRKRFSSENESSFLQLRFATVTDVVQKVAVNSQNVLNI